MYDSGNCPCFHWLRYIVRPRNILYNVLESVQCLPHLEVQKYLFDEFKDGCSKNIQGFNRKNQTKQLDPKYYLGKTGKVFSPNYNFQDSLSPLNENHPCFFIQLFWIRSINHQYSLGRNPVAWITSRTRIRYFCLSYNQMSRLAAPCYIVAF